MPVQQVFKQYQLITASNAEQMGLSVTAMLLQACGWQLASPMMCVAKPDGTLEYFVPMIQFEYVTTPDEPVEPPVPATEQ